MYKRAHRILTETTSAPSEHSDLRADAITFFILCNHLADWITQDKSNDFQSVAVRGSESMSLCKDIANTSKHSERDGGGKGARITEVTVL